MPPSRTRGTTGEAGTYLVAAQLALQGWPAALTTTGTPRTDLLAQVGNDELAAAIQVKTKSERSKGFEVTAIGSAAAKYANEWVVLVSLAVPPRRQRER